MAQHAIDMWIQALSFIKREGHADGTTTSTSDGKGVATGGCPLPIYIRLLASKENNNELLKPFREHSQQPAQ